MPLDVQLRPVHPEVRAGVLYCGDFCTPQVPPHLHSLDFFFCDDFLLKDNVCLKDQNRFQ